MVNIRERSAKLLEILQNGMHEREEAISLGYLCAIAGESFFMLGPTGTAKSLTARRLKYIFVDREETDGAIPFFEYRIGELSTPEELLRPAFVKGLNTGESNVGSLANANLIYLNDIWKAGPAIQNILLCYPGYLKLEFLVAASNQLPAEGQGLEALWDRFLVRLPVDNIADKDKLKHLLGELSVPCNNPFESLDESLQVLRLSLDELGEWRKGCQAIEVPGNIRDILLEVRKQLQDKNTGNSFYLSDRRLLKITKLLKASAFVHGRKEVSLTDLILLPYCLWNTKEQMATAQRLVAEILEQHSFAVTSFEQEIKSLEMSITSHLKEVDTERAKGVINPRLKDTFQAEEDRIYRAIISCRKQLKQQKQEQLGQPLFAAESIDIDSCKEGNIGQDTILQVLAKGFNKMETKLKSLEVNLKKKEPSIKIVPNPVPVNSLVGPWVGKKPSLNELKQVVSLHHKWLKSNKTKGQRAELQGANLQDFRLEDSNFQEANLQGVNLEGVNLKGANLQNTSLVDANLKGCELQGANLMIANLNGANLQGATYNNATKFSLSSSPEDLGMVLINEKEDIDSSEEDFIDDIETFGTSF